MRATVAVLALLAAAVAAPVSAAEVRAGQLTIRDAVFRAVPAGINTTAGYLTIANAGAKPDKLLSASCACAGKVEVHVTHIMNGSAMMMPGAAEVPARGQVSFGPGGLHLMVMGLKAPMTDGSSQAVTLKFQRAGTVSVPFAVKTRAP
jgi:copper(I)-binding protein